MSVAELQRKVDILEKAVLQLRFQQERHMINVTGAPVAPVTFSPKQFGDRIGRSAGWVRSEIIAGRIKAYGPPYLIPGSELVKFI